MRGPTKAFQEMIEGIEVAYHRAYDKLQAQVKAYLFQDEIEDDGKRNKAYLRDRILARMKRLKLPVVMISELEGVRRDVALQLSRNQDAAAEQAKKLERLAKRYHAPEAVTSKKVPVYSINPEFKEWLKENPEVERKVQKVVGTEKLCPIRKDKEHKGGINVQCER